MKTRHYSFIIPFLMDGALGMMGTAMPLLALRFGASAMFLGMLPFAAQTVRLPFCMTMGALSEHTGRAVLIVPAALVAAAGMLGLAFSQNIIHIAISFIPAVAAMGAFYPPLQAMIGERSPRGELTRNLSWFNAGWCIGGASLAMAGGYLLEIGQPIPFLMAAVAATAAMLFVVTWHSSTAGEKAGQTIAGIAEGEPGILLLAARIGHFLGFFSLAIGRNIFPKLAESLGFSEGDTGALVSMLLWGQALGIALANVAPWWKARVWPQMLAQALVLLAGTAIFLSSSGPVFAASFLALGVSLGIAYTAALYYAMQSRRNLGRNTSIHESLVALGNLVGALSGGAAAQYISLRAPYELMAALGLISLAATSLIALRARRLRSGECGCS